MRARQPVSEPFRALKVSFHSFSSVSAYSPCTSHRLRRTGFCSLACDQNHVAAMPQRHSPSVGPLSAVRRRFTRFVRSIIHQHRSRRQSTATAPDEHAREGLNNSATVAAPATAAAIATPAPPANPDLGFLNSSLLGTLSDPASVTQAFPHTAALRLRRNAC